MLIYIDGKLTDSAAIAVNDGAVLFGDTLFETMLARGKRIRFLSDHLDRLEFSATLLDFPFDRHEIESSLATVVEKLAAPASRVRLTLTRGPFEGLSFPPFERARTVITVLPFQEPTDAARRAGVACVLAPNRRVNPLSHLPQMKRGNYADCLYAADHARRLGAREALFVTENGRVLEGAATNLFLVRSGTLITPPAGGLVLPGIMRRQVLRAAARLNIPTHEREVCQSELHTADEVFLTSALSGVLPLAAVEDRPLNRGSQALRIWADVESNESACTPPPTGSPENFRPQIS